MKAIKSVFSIENIQDIGGRLGSDKYHTTDLKKAVETINSLLNEDQKSAFYSKTLPVIESIQFLPLNFAQIREYVEISFLLVIQNGEQRNFDFKKMRRIIKDCEIYAQRYEMPIIETNVKLTIGGTKTSKDLDLAKQKFKDFLHFFKDPINAQNIGQIELFVFGKRNRFNIDFYKNEKEHTWLCFDFNGSVV